MPYLKALSFPLAVELAEATLLRQDMRASLSAMKLWCEKYSKLEKPTLEEMTIRQSLFRDAIVQFIGCFDKTAPFSLSKDEVYKGTDGGAEYFQWLKDIRDAYAAHKFGPLRQCAVGVFVDLPESGQITIGDLISIYAGPTEERNNLDLISFMGVAANYLDSAVTALQEKLLTAAKATPIVELRALPNARAHGVNPEDIRLSREKFRNKVLKGDQK